MAKSEMPVNKLSGFMPKNLPLTAFLKGEMMISSFKKGALAIHM